MATFPRGLLVAVCVLAVVLPGALGQRGTTNVTSANSNGLGDTPVVGQYLDNPGCNAQSGGCIWPSDLAEFSSGSLFDVRVEVHSASNASSDHSVTITKVPGGAPQSLDSFFGVANQSSAPYTYSYATAYNGTKATRNSVGEYWRNVTITEAGVYQVDLTANGQTTKVLWTFRPATPRVAQNTILFIADGMTVPMITAARLISRGQSNGKFRRPMYMDTMPYVGLAHTSGTDAIITDSANSATAYNTGHKSAVNALNVYADTTSDSLEHPKMETLAEQAKRIRGMSVGVISTAEIQDATPAAVFAHTRRRDQKDYITDQLLSGTNVSDGAFSVVSGQGLNIEVILGGGGAYFHPPKSLGRRDYYQAFAGKGYSVALNRTAMYAAAADPATSKLLGIFHESNMDKWLDRNVFPQNVAAGKDYPDGSGRPAMDQPGLVDMLNVTLQILSRNPNGFYLMVEAASVDKMAHALDWERMLAELIEFDEAVGFALAWNAQRGNDTLIVATADHGHAYDVWGTVDTTAFNQAANLSDAEKRKAIGVYQAAGYPGYTNADVDNFPDTWAPRYTLAQGVADFPPFNENFQVHTSGVRIPSVAASRNSTTFNASNPATYYVANPVDAPGGLQQNGNLDPAQEQGVHTLTDVPVFAQGPGSIAFARVQDNTRVYFGMHDALGLASSDPTVTPDTMSTMCAAVRGF